MMFSVYWLFIILNLLNIKAFYSFFNLKTHSQLKTIFLDSNDRIETIASYSSEAFSKVEILNLIHNWGKETINDDNLDTLKLITSNQGATITFIADPGTKLEFSVKDDFADIKYVVSKISSTNSGSKSRSLILFSSRNLIESLATYLDEHIYTISQNLGDRIETNNLLNSTPNNDHPSGTIIDESENYKILNTNDYIGYPSSSSSNIDSKISFIKSYSNVNKENVGSVLLFLKNWVTKFSGKGIGISSTEIATGLLIKFDAYPDQSCSIEVVYIDQSRKIDIFLSRNNNISSNSDDSSMSDPLSTVISNIAKSLQKDIETLLLKDDEIEMFNVQTPKGSSNNRPPTFKDSTQPFKFDEEEKEKFKSEGDGLPFSSKDSRLHQDSTRETLFVSKSPTSTSTSTTRKRDPELVQKAQKMRLNLEKFENVGLEEQAMKELNEMVENSKKKGFLSVINFGSTTNSSNAAARASNNMSSSSSTVNKEENQDMIELFKTGMNISATTWQEMIARPSPYITEDLSIPPTKLPINLAQAGLEKGIDIFEGPPLSFIATPPDSSVEGRRLLLDSQQMLSRLDPIQFEQDRNRMSLLLNDLRRSNEEMHELVLDSYKDLLLSDSFLYIMKNLNETEYDDTTRKLCFKIVNKAQLLNSELGALAKSESVRHLQMIHDICTLAADYQQDEITFLNQLDILKPRFDTSLLSYMKFAIEEEEMKIKAIGSDPVRFPSKWLQILQVISQGVFAEIENRFERLLEPLLLVARFSNYKLQGEVFKRFVNITATLDLPYLKELALNMACSLESASNKDSLPVQESIYENTIRFKELVETYLSDDYINERFDKIQKQAKDQNQELSIIHRNPIIQAEIDELKKSQIELDKLIKYNNFGLPLFDKNFKGGDENLN